MSTAESHAKEFNATGQLEQHGKVVYAHLKNQAIEFSATDWLHPTRKPKQGNTVCMYISGGMANSKRSSTSLQWEPTKRSLMSCEICRLGATDISPTNTVSIGSSRVRKSQRSEGYWHLKRHRQIQEVCRDAEQRRLRVARIDL